MSEPDEAVVATPSTGSKPARPRRSRGLVVAWSVLAAVLVASLLFAAWQLVGSNQLARNNASAMLRQFDAACASGVNPETTPGTAIATLTVPAWGDSRLPVVAGVDPQQLSRGVGWLPASAVPGVKGNTVIAGYRSTNGAPFERLLELSIGDQLVVETCTDVYTYELDVAPATLIVGKHDDWVLDAVPGKPGLLPTASMLTVVTSQDKLPTDDRAVGMAHLVSATAK